MLDMKPVEVMSARELGLAFRELDRDAKLAIRRGIKGSIGQVTSRMQSDIESAVDGAPMSGMVQPDNAKQNWAYPTVKPSFRPSAGEGKAIAQITAKGRKGFTRMFAITELAGTRSAGFTQGGKRMVRVLGDRFKLVKGKGGRFVFAGFVRHRTLMHDQVEVALNLLAAKTNVEVKRG